MPGLAKPAQRRNNCRDDLTPPVSLVYWKAISFRPAFLLDAPPAPDYRPKEKPEYAISPFRNPHSHGSRIRCINSLCRRQRQHRHPSARAGRGGAVPPAAAGSGLSGSAAGNAGRAGSRSAGLIWVCRDCSASPAGICPTTRYGGCSKRASQRLRYPEYLRRLFLRQFLVSLLQRPLVPGWRLQ